MRKRHKISRWKKAYWDIIGFFSNLKHSKRNFMAAYSARYILEEFKTQPNLLAEFTGLPKGVIVAAFKNIFPEDHPQNKN